MDLIFHCYHNWWPPPDFFQLNTHEWQTSLSVSSDSRHIRRIWLEPSEKSLLDSISQAFGFVSRYDNPWTHHFISYLLLPTDMPNGSQTSEIKNLAVDEGLLHVLSQVSQPHMSVRRTTAVLQTAPWSLKICSSDAKSVRKFPNSTRASRNPGYSDFISNVSVCIDTASRIGEQLSTKPNSSSLRVSSLIKLVQSVSITLHFDGAKLNPYLPGSNI